MSLTTMPGLGKSGMSRNFAAGQCRAEACYAPVLKSFARNFDATVAAVRELRGSNWAS
jgi:hypothetical protein